MTWELDTGEVTADLNTPRCSNRRTIIYQGRLNDAGTAVNGQYDLRFTVFNQLTGGCPGGFTTGNPPVCGTPGGSVVTVENVTVTNGIFTVPLNFGIWLTNNFGDKYLEIEVRPGASSGTDPFTVLTPRQPLTNVPFATNAQYAVNAGNATTAANVIGGSSVVLPLTTNAPPANHCDEDSERGNAKVAAANNRLWICTTTGWKSLVLQ